MGVGISIGRDYVKYKVVFFSLWQSGKIEQKLITEVGVPLLLFNDAPSPPWKIAYALQPMASWQVYIATSRWPLLDKVPDGPHPQVVDPTPFFVSLSLCNPTTALRLLSCGLSCLLCLGLCRCSHQDAYKSGRTP